MKLIKPRTFIIFALVCISGAILLRTSQNVQDAEDRLSILQASVEREQEQIRMLRAEWEGLNNPARLEKLANEFLDLVPPSPDQMAAGEVLLPRMVSQEELHADESQIHDEQGFAPAVQNISYIAPIPKAKPQILKPSDKDIGDIINEVSSESAGAQ